MQNGWILRKGIWKSREMDDLIRITMLNDYIFCPASIYFHNLYGSRETMLYQGKAQFDGTKAHASIDNESYLKSKKILTGMTVFSERYGLVGKIDAYDMKTCSLIERKKKIKKIYDGYVFQLYAQYFCMTEMGYRVDELFLYSMDDNKKYKIKLPEENDVMLQKFERTIRDIKTTNIEDYVQENREKCMNCIYFEACDRGKA